jgi:heptosyltransferase-2
MSVPAFVALRQRFPDSRITLLALQSANAAQGAKVAAYAGGATNAPWIDLVKPHLIDDVISLASVRSLSKVLSTRQALRQRRFDLIISMIDVGCPWGRRLRKMLFLTALVGFVPQLGWRREGAIHISNVPPDDPGLGHHVHGPLQFLTELDGPDSYRDEDVHFDLRPDRASRTWAADWHRDVAGGRRLVALAPGAIHSHKNWPEQKFAALAKQLLQDGSDIRIVVVGSASEVAKAEHIRAVDPERILSLAGRSSISQSAALFARCELVVGNDGGAMHLADAMGARVVSIIPGIEFPNSIEPWHNRENAVRRPISCSPCYSFTFCPLGHARCMTEISVSAVLSRCRLGL